MDKKFPKKKTVLRFTGTRKLAQEFKRRLWSALTKGKKLPAFKVDHYLTTIFVVFYDTVDPEEIYHILGQRGRRFKRGRGLDGELLEVLAAVSRLPGSSVALIASEVGLSNEITARLLEELREKNLVSVNRWRWRITNVGRHVLHQVLELEKSESQSLN